MDELISKRAVIEAIEKARANVGHNLERSIGKSIIEILDDVGRDVDRLPSALGTNLAEVGTDCISRQAAIDAVRATLLAWSYMPKWRDNKIIEAVKRLPPIQPKRGKWIKKHRHYGGFRDYTGFDAMGEQHTITVDERTEYDDLYCSECGARSADNFLNFCSNCGAKMEE